MARVVSATEARVHFGELMREVVQGDQPVIVEKSGTEQVVVLSVTHYRRLLALEHAQPDWRQLLEDTHRMLGAELGDRRLPLAADVIGEMREERDAEYLGVR